MQGAQGQLTTSKGPQRVGNLYHEKGIAFPSKVFCSSKQQICTSFFMCVQNKKELAVQVKNKPHVEIRNMRLFLVHQSSWQRTATLLSYCPFNECSKLLNSLRRLQFFSYGSHVDNIAETAICLLTKLNLLPQPNR